MGKGHVCSCSVCLAEIRVTSGLCSKGENVYLADLAYLATSLCDADSNQYQFLLTNLFFTVIFPI